MILPFVVTVHLRRLFFIQTSPQLGLESAKFFGVFDEDIHEITANLLSKVAQLLHVLQHGGGKAPLLDGYFAQGSHNLGELYILRTLGVTTITLHAAPNNRVAKDLLAHAEQDLANDLAGIEFGVNLANRASGGAGAAGKTGFDVLAAGARSDFELEIRVKFFGL